MTTEQSEDADLPVSHSWRIALGATILYAFIAIFCLLAVRNLLRPHFASWLSLAASATWLVLVAVGCAATCHYLGGVTAALVNAAGNYSMRQFVWIETAADGEKLFSYGYTLLGWRFYYRKVAVGGIRKVSWSAGQGSHLAGKDLDDWSVAVWYDTAAVRYARTPDHRRHAEELDIIGLPDSKKSIEQFGQSIRQFLEAHGAILAE